ncbi:MAG: hypothetical protein ACOYX5_05785 [Actinomycetota bacterium]
MGLSNTLARAAARHAHVLLVESPGYWRTRASVERAVLDRGWHLAHSPADADVLVVCGEAGPNLTEAVERVWDQLPGPRVRVDVREYDEATARLDRAHRELLDTDPHRHDAHERPTAQDFLADGDEEDGHGEMHHGDMDHGEMDHGGMDHGDMDMSPGGIPLAEGGEDRDGLEMDVLRVRLGPVLPHWPAGLVLRCALQGDVVTEAQAELVDGGARRPEEAAPLARRLDNLASLLALAGWDDAAGEAARLRDAALQDGGARVTEELERLRRRVRRSWTLRWSLRGLRMLSEQDVHHLGLPADAVGDTYGRLVGMLDRATEAEGQTAQQSGTHAQHRARTVPADRLGRVVTGLDLATARLVLASLDLDGLHTEHTAHTVPGTSHG